LSSKRLLNALQYRMPRCVLALPSAERTFAAAVVVETIREGL